MVHIFKSRWNRRFSAIESLKHGERHAQMLHVDWPPIKTSFAAILLHAIEARAMP